jgi:hypothetical protein
MHDICAILRWFFNLMYVVNTDFKYSIDIEEISFKLELKQKIANLSRDNEV